MSTKATQSPRTFSTQIKINPASPHSKGVPVADDPKTYLESRKRTVVDKAREAEVLDAAEQALLSAARAREERRDIQEREGKEAGETGKKEGDEHERIFQVDEDKRQLRIKKEGEIGLTRTEALDFLKDLDKVKEPPIVVLHEGMNQYVPNWENERAKKEPDVAWAVAKQYNNLLNNNQPADPIALFLAQQDQAEQMKKAMGVKENTGQENQGMSTLKDLKELGLLRIPQEGSKELADLLEKYDAAKTGKSEDVKALEAQVKQLLDAQQLEREKTLLTAIKKVNDDMEKLQTEIRLHPPGSTTELDLIKTIGERLVTEGGEVRKGVFMIAENLMKKSPQLPANVGDKKANTEKIAEEAGRQEALAKLGNDLFMSPGS